MTGLSDPLISQTEGSSDVRADGLHRHTVASRRIAIPVWKLFLICRLQESKRLDIFSEFILRCIDAEIDRIQSITEFLCMPETVVIEVLAELLSSKYIVANPDDVGSGEPFKLTHNGKTVLAELVEVRPVQEELVFHLDTLAEDLRQYDKLQLLSPTQVDAQRLVVLPTVPSREPILRSADNVRLSAAYGSGSRRSSKTFLGFVDHARKSEKLFMEGQLNVFVTSDRDRPLDIEIFVDDRAVPALTIAFLEKDYLRSMRLSAVLAEDDSAVRSLIFGDEAGVVDESDQVLQMAEGAVELSLDLERILAGIRAEAASGASAQDDNLIERTDEMGAAITKLHEALAAVPIRRTTLSEHSLWLERAFESSVRSITIALSHLDLQFWSDKFLPLVLSASASGVQINLYIKGESSTRDLYVVPEFLLIAAQEIPKLSVSALLIEIPDLLAVDGDWCVVTVEKLGCPPGTFARRVIDGRGVLVRDATIVARLVGDLSAGDA